MKMRVMRLAWLSAALPLGGCGLLPDAYSGCDEVRPYQSATEAAPLRVPPGSDLPDTRNALRIPELTTPEMPREPGACLEHPPADRRRGPGGRDLGCAIVDRGGRRSGWGLA